jgi:hypothetical protein
MTPQEWDWAVSAALADGAWWQSTALTRAIHCPRPIAGYHQQCVKGALLRLVAAGVVEQRGSHMGDGRPQFRLARRTP